MASVDFPNSPTTNQVFSSGNIQFIWDGAKWASGSLTGYAPIQNPAGGQNNYSPIASPTFTGTPAGPTATVGTNSTQLATTAFVATAISGASSLYAPITNPASGSGNYAAMNNTVLTGNATVAAITASGTVSAPQLTATTALTAPLVNAGTGGISMNAAGALNLPDTSEWTSAGLTIYAPPSGSTSRSSVYFGTGGAVPPTTIYASLNAGPTNLAIAGGAHTSGTSWIADATTAGAVNVGGGGWTFYNVTGQTVGSAITWGNPVMSLVPTQAQFNVPVLLNTVAQNVSFALGSNLTSGVSVSLQSGGTGAMNFGIGTYNNGTNWIATATGASLFTSGSGNLNFYANSGLTVGASYSPTLTFQCQPTQNVCYVQLTTAGSTPAVIGGALTVNGDASPTRNLWISQSAGSAVSYGNVYVSYGIRSGAMLLNGDSSGNGFVYWSNPWAFWFRGSDATTIWQNATPAYYAWVYSTGAFYGASYNSTSDIRLKRDVKRDTRGLNVVRQLEPKTFIRTGTCLKTDGFAPPGPPPINPDGPPLRERVEPKVRDFEPEFGFVAQDLVDVLPEAVSEVDEMKAYNPVALIAALVNAVQELDRKVEALEARWHP